MPLYEYRCRQRHVEERFRTIGCRDLLVTCPHCGDAMERQITVPAVRIIDRGPGFWRTDRDSGPSKGPAIHVWDSERKFPNLRKDGDGTMSFPSKAAYKAYLKEKNIAEVSTDARIENPHGRTKLASA